MTTPSSRRQQAVRFIEETAEPVPAATVVMLRDAPEGLQVFMLERHIKSDFAGGAYVFPGGKVDEADCGLPADRWIGLDPEVAAARMQVAPSEALGYHVAAVRELFEEAGILLARRDGRPVGAETLASASFVEANRRLSSREVKWDWREWLADEGLVLDLGVLAWWSWWVTPLGVHRRYDTRFFVAPLPEGQAARHDEVETSASRWVTPAAALQAAREREITVIYPTRKNLQALEEYESAERLLVAAHDGRVDTRRTQPEVVDVGGGQNKVRHPHTGELGDL